MLSLTLSLAKRDIHLLLKYLFDPKFKRPNGGPLSPQRKRAPVIWEPISAMEFGCHVIWAPLGEHLITFFLLI